MPSPLTPPGAPHGRAWKLDREGWIPGLPRHASPHHNARPEGLAVDLLVIHNISLPAGEFGGPWIDDLFMGVLDPGAHPSFGALRGLRVSAHFLIGRDGTVTQFVSTLRRAWHAGLSAFHGRQDCNDFSVGIELEGSDHVPFTDAQYASLHALTLTIRHAHPQITTDRITGHSDIAPGRKTDPGPHFDWLRYRRDLDAG